MELSVELLSVNGDDDGVIFEDVVESIENGFTMLSRSGLLSCGMSAVGSCFRLSRSGLLKIAVM